MAYNLPAIVKQAERLMADIEIAVAHFPRKHRYTVGTDLRTQAMTVACLTHKAWRNTTQRSVRIAELSEAIDDLKLRMQLAQQIHAFASFQQFEALGRLVTDLGRQCGGWQKRRNTSGQNGAAPASVQRSPILSSHAASTEAKS